MGFLKTEERVRGREGEGEWEFDNEQYWYHFVGFEGR